jgi:DNA modification methylase
MKIAYQNENVTLYHGDCREWSGKADACITDPPYGHGWKGVASSSPGGRNWTRRRAVAIVGTDKPFDPLPWLSFKTVVLWGANHYASRLPDSPAWLVWDKREGTAENNLSDCELAWCNVGGSARLIGHMWNGLCRASEVGEHLHPTQKPIVVMAWCMERAKVPEGATVLDPFCGSGTTLIAALETGRKAIGIEIDERWVEVARRRLERWHAQGMLPLTYNAGRTFDGPKETL